MTLRPAGMLIGAAVSLAGCSIDVDEWNVAGGLRGAATCRPVAALALNNLGWRHPARPQGTITVGARDCPRNGAWPVWADPSQCWQVEIPLDPGPERRAWSSRGDRSSAAT